MLISRCLRASRALFEALGVLLKPLRVFWEFLGASWQPFGSLLEPLGAILGRLGAKLCGLGATFRALDFLDDFLERFWEQKGCSKGGIWGAKTEQKSMKKRGANSRAKKSPLGIVLVRFCVDFQGVLGSKILIFHLFLQVFVKIHVFDKDECPRAI